MSRVTRYNKVKGTYLDTSCSPRQKEAYSILRIWSSHTSNETISKEDKNDPESQAVKVSQVISQLSRRPVGFEV